MKPGWQTSEFWLSLAALGYAAFATQADAAVTNATGRLSQHGTLGVLAGAAIAGAYSVGRSLVKAKAESAKATGISAGPFTPAR